MKRYNDYSSYLKTRFGSKVYRIGLDAGFGCPGRCAYCNSNGSRSSYTDPAKSIREQLAGRIAYLKKHKLAQKFVAYFQSHTNTFAAPDLLKDTYDSILPVDCIVGLSIGTRPDCIDDEKLDIIASYVPRYEVWIEYGLQSIHDRTLNAIGRGHTLTDFMNAIRLTRKHPIKICAHVILGLPGESKRDMLATADTLSEIGIDAVKIHPLHILKGSALEGDYERGGIELLTENEYVDIACDFLERLSPEIIIQRLTGQGTRQDHIAPLWALDKPGTLIKIDEEMAGRGSRQGLKSSVYGLRS